MKHKGLKKFPRILFIYIPAGFFIFTLSWVLVLKWIPVYFTPLMVIRYFENFNNDTYKIYKVWKPIDEISPDMAMAVMAGEDTRFLEHKGFDWVEIDNAMDAKKKGKKLRGASTISQQTAKNVFLFPGRSWIRKGLEAYFTCLIEIIWGKERIMEVYLNVAEMGRGIFGAGAAAERLFHTGATKLTRRQAALIAAVLPDPVRRKADAPTAYISGRAIDIQYMMGLIPRPGWLDKKNGTKIEKKRKKTGSKK